MTYRHNEAPSVGSAEGADLVLESNTNQKDSHVQYSVPHT